MSTDIRRLKFDISRLVNEMLDKLPSEVFTSSNTTFLDPEMAGGQFVVEVIKRLRTAGHSDANIASRVHGIASSLIGLNYAVNRHKLVGQFVLNKDFGMKKFDVVLGNPPYQTLGQTGTKTQPIWDKFVLKAFEVCASDGYVMLIHPAGWRNVEGRFEAIRDLLYSKQLQYLEIHNEKDGLTTFGAETRYDWYCAKNSPKNGGLPLVCFEDGSEQRIDVTAIPFIPNRDYGAIKKLIAKPGEETVEVLHSESAYESRRLWMNQTKTSEFKYPIIYTVTGTSIPTFKWSSCNDKGHFGVPKFIWSNGRISSIGSILDVKGEYGLTQFAYAIVDSVTNLPEIKKAFDSDAFRNLMEAASVGQLSVNYKVLPLFRKDFWKDFV